MFSYIFTEHALADIVKQSVYYEEKQKGLGDRFVDEVQNTAEEIRKTPNGFINNYRSSRELKTKHFPYKLIYTIEERIIYIHAVYPCKSNPKRKYNRIKR